jgi:hypothetical protein
MGKQIDFVIKKAGNPIAFVEVKNRKKFSIDDAVKLRKNLLPDLNPPHSGYLLLISQDHGYLWKNTSNDELEKPSSAFPMNAVIQRYFKVGNPETRLRNTELEFIIYQWLNELTFKPRTEQFPADPEKSLFECGLIQEMYAAQISMEDSI